MFVFVNSLLSFAFVFISIVFRFIVSCCYCN